MIEKIKNHLLKLERMDYAFLFGSAVKAIRPESDIDILIGGKLTSSERIDLAMDLELLLRRKVDLVLSREASCEVILEAFSKGVAILVANKQKLKGDYFKNFYLYDDTRNLRELRRLKVKRMYASG